MSQPVILLLANLCSRCWPIEFEHRMQSSKNVFCHITSYTIWSGDSVHKRIKLIQITSKECFAFMAVNYRVIHMYLRCEINFRGSSVFRLIIISVAYK